MKLCHCASTSTARNEAPWSPLLRGEWWEVEVHAFRSRARKEGKGGERRRLILLSLRRGGSREARRRLLPSKRGHFKRGCAKRVPMMRGRAEKGPTTLRGYTKRGLANQPEERRGSQTCLSHLYGPLFSSSRKDQRPFQRCLGEPLSLTSSASGFGVLSMKSLMLRSCAEQVLLAQVHHASTLYR